MTMHIIVTGSQARGIHANIAGNQISIAFYYMFYNSFILHCLERGIKPMSPPHNGRNHISLSGI